MSWINFIITVYEIFFKFWYDASSSQITDMFNSYSTLYNNYASRVLNQNNSIYIYITVESFWGFNSSRSCNRKNHTPFKCSLKRQAANLFSFQIVPKTPSSKPFLSKERNDCHKVSIVAANYVQLFIVANYNYSN